MGKYYKGADIDITLEDPLKSAYEVFDRWYKTVEEHADDMANNYRIRIKESANNPRVRERIILGLASYYASLLRKNVPERFAEIMGEVKAEMKRLKKEIAKRVKSGASLEQAIKEVIVVPAV